MEKYTADHQTTIFYLLKRKLPVKIFNQQKNLFHE